MKTTITKFFLLLTLSILLHSCSFGEHYHDGKYRTNILFAELNYEIKGNEITIDNSVTGISKLSCRQYPDRIEYTEDNGTTRVLTAMSNGDLKISDRLVLYKIGEIVEPKNSSMGKTTIENKEEGHPTLQNTNADTKRFGDMDFEREAEKQYRYYRKDILRGGVAFDSEETFASDLNNDGQNEIIKYYTLAPKDGGCMYVGRGILVYENTKIGVIESQYDPNYAFEFTGIEKGNITVSKLDFDENDMCYPTIPTQGILLFKNHKLIFE